MKRLQILSAFLGSVLLLCLVAAGLSYAQEPLDPDFTYQGQLALNGQPVNGQCDLPSASTMPPAMVSNSAAPKPSG